jgi:hypothetical protein
VSSGLTAEADLADLALRLRADRDQTLLLLGFWRSFRSDDLCRLRIETNQLESGGLSLFPSCSKTDREHQGRTFLVPALVRLFGCPVLTGECSTADATSPGEDGRVRSSGRREAVNLRGRVPGFDP